MTKCWIFLSLTLLIVACNSSDKPDYETASVKTRRMNEDEFKKLAKLTQEYKQVILAIDSMQSEEIVRPPYGLKLGFTDKANAILVDTLDFWENSVLGKSFLTSGASLTGYRGIGMKEIIEMKIGNIEFEDYSEILNELGKRKYLVYMRHAIPAKPRIIGNSSFEPGYIVTRITVYDLDSKQIVFRNFLKSTNSTQVESNEYGIQEADLYRDLYKNYNSDVHTALSESFEIIE